MTIKPYIMQIIWLLMALMWSTVRLFAIRSTIPDENDWGFGQCLATAMLVLLLFSALENYIGMLSPRKYAMGILLNY